MNTKHLFSLLLLLLIALLPAACGGTAAAPTAEPEPAAEEEAPAAAESDAAPTGGTQTFVVVTEESQASYIVNEEFFADALEKLGIAAGEKVVVGTTPDVSGEIQLNFDGADLVEAAQFTVDMTGLSTDQSRRDEWLQDNAIETSAFPQATFTATSFSGLPETYTEGEAVNFQMTGDLTVRDVTNSVTFDVTAVHSGDTLSGTATLDLQMSDFGITPPDFVNTLTVADAFTIEVDITARRSG